MCHVVRLLLTSFFSAVLVALERVGHKSSDGLTADTKQSDLGKCSEVVP